ncbi:MAG TPA: SDR family NAD(P)-dependent oxidoreductase, partial [Terriglobia bacterium]|nr:SDR family NAD(P)-dependent oxidoreductase [Terriglobia bacterium]
SKHGAAGFTNTLRAELRGQGIRVIGLYPGATDTAIWEQFWPGAPRRRMISTASIARAVVFALSLPPEATVEELVIAPTAGAL